MKNEKYSCGESQRLEVSGEKIEKLKNCKPVCSILFSFLMYVPFAESSLGMHHAYDYHYLLLTRF